MKHRLLIEALGAATIATRLGVEASAPRHWCKRGIPAAHWDQLVVLARARGIEIEIEDLARDLPPPRARIRRLRP